MSKPPSKKAKEEEKKEEKPKEKPKDKKDESTPKAKTTSPMALSIAKGLVVLILTVLLLRSAGCAGNDTASEPSIEQLRQMIEESNRVPLPTGYGLYKKGVSNSGPGVTMKASYLPGGDVLLDCWSEENGVPVYHTLRWSPTSTKALNGQWTRTEHYKSGGFLTSVKTTTSEYSGSLMVSSIPGTDRLAIALFTPDKNDPSKDRLLGEDWGGGEGVLHPVW